MRKFAVQVHLDFTREIDGKLVESRREDNSDNIDVKDDSMTIDEIKLAACDIYRRRFRTSYGDEHVDSGSLNVTLIGFSEISPQSTG